MIHTLHYTTQYPIPHTHYIHIAQYCIYIPSPSPFPFLYARDVLAFSINTLQNMASVANEIVYRKNSTSKTAKSVLVKKESCTAYPLAISTNVANRPIRVATITQLTQ